MFEVVLLGPGWHDIYERGIASGVLIPLAASLWMCQSHVHIDITMAIRIHFMSTILPIGDMEILA